VTTELLIVLAVLAIVAVAAIALWASRQRQSRKLRERFGPEYERTVGASRDRREAEAELRARQERVDALEIRPLAPDARDRYTERWREVQAMFVDDPGSAVDQADELIGQVMRARGYPVGDFEQRAADVSVNHPQVVDHYRTAHAIALKRQSGDGATEQLRQAFVHYRALFADLLETSDRNGTDAPTRAPETTPGQTTTEGPMEAAEQPAETPTQQRSQLASRPGGISADRPTPGTETAVETEEPADPARSAR
jgi:hypothetical protein